jgi:hypothetical protein
MPFATGAHVVVLTLGRKRGIVVETSRGGRYRVLVDNATISCREVDLIASPEEPRRTRLARKREDRAPARDTAVAAPPGRVDLHGLTVEEALARVLEEIDLALRRGADHPALRSSRGQGVSAGSTQPGRDVGVFLMLVRLKPDTTYGPHFAEHEARGRGGRP